MERITLLPQTSPWAPAARSGRPAPTTRPFTALADALIAALERGRQRRALRRLDERMLRDIGLSPAHVEEEAGKPFWRP